MMAQRWERRANSAVAIFASLRLSITSAAHSPGSDVRSQYQAKLIAVLSRPDCRTVHQDCFGMRVLTYAIMLHHVVAEKRVIPGRIRDDRPKSERCRELPPYGGRSNYPISGGHRRHG